MKTWQVGPYHDDWVAIVHAGNRGQARKKGAHVDFAEFTDIRAIRLPELDGKLITVETLLAAGFPETVEGEPLEAWGYITDCASGGCDVCKRSLEWERREKQQ